MTSTGTRRPQTQPSQHILTVHAEHPAQVFQYDCPGRFKHLITRIGIGDHQRFGARDFAPSNHSASLIQSRLFSARTQVSRAEAYRLRAAPERERIGQGKTVENPFPEQRPYGFINRCSPALLSLCGPRSGRNHISGSEHLSSPCRHRLHT